MSSCVSGTLNVKLQFVLGRREVVKTFALELKHFVSGTITSNIANMHCRCTCVYTNDEFVLLDVIWSQEYLLANGI